MQVEDSQYEIATLRENCQGVAPLSGTLSDWMIAELSQWRNRLFAAVETYGSPLNFIHPATLRKNLCQLALVASSREIDFKPYFARKANKCLAFAKAALVEGCGIDVASENELQQVLNLGMPTEDAIICTAAIKSESLLRVCIANEVVIALDNDIEVNRCLHLAEQLGCKPRTALRLGGFMYQDAKLYTRFGFDVAAIDKLYERLGKNAIEKLNIIGIHFHLDGYEVGQRITAIEQCLQLVSKLADRGHKIEFLDIGGGLPISYLKSSDEWSQFWTVHRSALLHEVSAITYRNHPLGLQVIGREVSGTPNVYPFYQCLERDEWLATILDSRAHADTALADRIRAAGIQLRCEPGRSALEGCGFIAAKVESIKQHVDGHWLIGLAMNRTQCRTSSDDFLVDPILLPTAQVPEATTGNASGYFVGAYCTESELISLRRFNFSKGVSVGDIVVFPNTAGYLMHFLESRSHQFPLAKNIIVDGAEDDYAQDPIDTMTD